MLNSDSIHRTVTNTSRHKQRAAKGRMWTNRRCTSARERQCNTHFVPPNTTASLRFHETSDKFASGVTPAQGGPPCAPISRFLLVSRALASNTENSDLRATTRWARLSAGIASIQCTDRWAQGRRLEKRGLDHWDLRIGGIVIVLRCAPPRT